MILTTSYLFSHLSPDSSTLFITPYNPPVKRDSTELVPIDISRIAYFLRSDSPSESDPPASLTCHYLGRNSESSFNTFKFTLDSDSPPLPDTLDHLIVSTKEVDPELLDVVGRRRCIDIVLNPKSGHGYSSALLDDVVRPLLKPFEERGLFDVKVWETRAENDGERIGREIAEARKARDKTVMVFGGDGTVHEVLNGAVLDEEGKPRSDEAQSLDLVLIPTGTANALYFHLFPPESSLYPDSTPHSPFYSFLSFLRQSTSKSSRPLPLPLALNTINRRSHSPSASGQRLRPTLTSVVTSAALHACLLYDAEKLRSTHPGLERFKIAAQENVENWWTGTLALGSGNGGGGGTTVKRYNPNTKTFEDVLARHENQEEDGEEGEEARGTKLEEGPFAYWVSSLVSRFEPSFVVAPLRSPLHPLAPLTREVATIDLVVIRPLRHVPTRDAYEKCDDGNELEAVRVRKDYAEKVWQVTGGMYQGGRHVDMAYSKGEGVNREGETEMVEVWRTNEFVWTPTPSSNLKANLVCFDGALHDLGEGGSLKTKVLGCDETGVRVWN